MAHDGAFAQFLRTYLVNAESDNESGNEGMVISYFVMSPRDVQNIGIIYVFSCINICRGSRKLFEPEAARPRVQTASERHS